MINEKNFFSENKKINVSNTTSLVNLKAELFKKKQDAFKNKSINKKDDFERINSSKNISNSKWNQKAIKLDEKIRESIKNNREKLMKSTEDDELDNELKKSKENMLKKTKLYDEKMKKAFEKLANKDELKEDNEEEELIDFERKIMDEFKYGSLKNNLITADKNQQKEEEEEEDPEELVEYLDSFGRTRKCKRKELKKIQKLNEQDLLRRKLDRDLTTEDKSTNLDCKTNDLYSNFIKSTDNNDLEDEDQHYQSITKNEIREHGTSYYQFSLDEEKRKEEMDKLDELRKQTFAQRKKADELNEKRNELMKQRLLKLAKRKGIVKEDDDDKKINLDQYIKNVTTTNDDQKIEDSNYLIGKKEKKLREWDLDKNEFMDDKTCVFIDKKRNSSNQTNLDNDNKSYFFIDKGHTSSNKYNLDLGDKDSSDDELSKFNPEFAPPSDLYDNKRKKMKSNKTAEDKVDEFLSKFTMNQFK